MTNNQTKEKRFFLKKGDFILGLVFIVLVIGVFVYRGLLPATQNGYAEITVNGQVYRKVSLSDTETFTIETAQGHNMVEIKDNRICVTKASCPDGLCIRQGAIYKQGESIVCLPNGVVITVKEGQDNAVDFING